MNSDNVTLYMLFKGKCINKSITTATLLQYLTVILLHDIQLFDEMYLLIIVHVILI